VTLSEDFNFLVVTAHGHHTKMLIYHRFGVPYLSKGEQAWILSYPIRFRVSKSWIRPMGFA